MTNLGPGRRILVEMQPRDPRELHRAATPLELLYDLVFVVAIAQAATQLHHAIAHGQFATGAASFLMVFFAIWWAWMNFTWFASAFDTDDALYRIKVLIQMVGVLVLAAGVPQAFLEHDLVLIVIGYVIMRIALVSQWLRAASSSENHRTTARRYAAGITLCQLAWIGFLFVPHAIRWPLFILLVAAELAVPMWAESAHITPWHRHHIAERYGLFTIIVIGESVLAATLAVQAAVLESGMPNIALWVVIAAAPLIFFALWWLYFFRPHHELLESSRDAFFWGYTHFVVFASLAAVGAGLALIVDQVTHHTELSNRAAGIALAVPVAAFLASLWFVRVRCERGPRAIAASYLGAAAALLLLPIVLPLVATTILIAAVLVVLVAAQVICGCPPSEHALDDEPLAANA